MKNQANRMKLRINSGWEGRLKVSLQQMWYSLTIKAVCLDDDDFWCLSVDLKCAIVKVEGRSFAMPMSFVFLVCAQSPSCRASELVQRSGFGSVIS